MKWYEVGKSRKIPAQGQEILVFGFCESETSSKGKEREVGLVNFDRFLYSTCKDTSGYSVWYTDITKWAEIEEPKD